MIPLQYLFIILFSVYLIGALIICNNYFSQTNHRMTTVNEIFIPADEIQHQEPEVPEEPINTPKLFFEDYITAYYVLQELDVFEPITIQYINVSKGAAEDYYKPFLGLKPDDNYCARHRARLVTDPSFIFESQNYLLMQHPITMLRSKVIPEIGGTDIHPDVSYFMPPEIYKDFRYDMKADITNYFTHDEMYIQRYLGKQFSCLTQMSNHLPGHENLYRKDFVAQVLTRYSQLYENNTQCFSSDKFFPTSWVLYQPAQCRAFFKEFNSPEYQVLKKERKIVYMRKIGAFVHKGRGVVPVDEEEEQYLRELYGNGTLCGEINRHYLVQYYVHNPLLMDNRKFDFRIYMLIASSNPVIVYSYDGYVRVSIPSYDTETEHIGALLTNTALNEEFFKLAEQNGTYDGMNREELEDYHIWNFTKLHKYLYEKQIVDDDNWLDNYLRPEIRKVMIHLVRMAQSSFLSRSSVYELFGLDLMMDSDLKLWFIEANAKPGINGFSEDNKVFIKKMLVDHFEIITGLLRSRTKRIINFVNNLIVEKQAWKISSDRAYIIDVETRREEFKEISKNYFEPEYEPSAGNMFFKIVDDNLNGVERYAGLIDEECL